MTGLPDPAQKPLLTVAEVAALMPAGVGEKAVRAAIAAGQLPSTRVGRYVLVPTHRLLAEVLQAPKSEAGPATGPAVATTETSPQETRHADGATIRALRGA